jgi:CheY-like chemotaxis protein
MPFKRKFWAAAPLRLSHDPGRFFVQLNGTPAAADSAPSIPAHVHRPLVLVVDDDESMKSLVACYVEQLGYRTLTASDPLEALDVMAKRSVDVVITDALMPKMDGRELCRRIKSSPEGQSQKVIVMTSLYKSRAYEMEAIHRFGADALIKKPLDLKTLNALMEELAPIE